MHVVMKMSNGIYEMSYLRNEEGNRESFVTRSILLNPEYGEQYVGTELETAYKVHMSCEKEARRLTELEIKFYRLSQDFPEAYSKIAEVLRKTNPTVLAVMVHISNLITLRKEKERETFRKHFKLLKVEDFEKYQKTMELLKQNDEKVWNLVMDI